MANFRPRWHHPLCYPRCPGVRHWGAFQVVSTQGQPSRPQCHHLEGPSVSWTGTLSFGDTAFPLLDVSPGPTSDLRGRLPPSQYPGSCISGKDLQFEIKGQTDPLGALWPLDGSSRPKLLRWSWFTTMASPAADLRDAVGTMSLL